MLAPINLFYDITPTGRTLNRLSKDMGTVDQNIDSTIGYCILSIVLCKPIFLWESFFFLI